MSTLHLAGHESQKYPGGPEALLEFVDSLPGCLASRLLMGAARTAAGRQRQAAEAYGHPALGRAGASTGSMDAKHRSREHAMAEAVRTQIEAIQPVGQGGGWSRT